MVNYMMTNRELILNLQNMFNKNQTERKSEKEMAKNPYSVESVIKGYYSKNEDVKTALEKVTEVFEIISRKRMRDKDTSPEKYSEALKVMYFSEDSIRRLKELLPDFKDYFDDVKKSIKDCSSKPVNYASTMKKIDKILNDLMRPSPLSLENTDLPALVCYLLKLKKRIEKYNGMVEKSNSDKKAERDTGAEPLPKSSINKKREREREKEKEDSLVIKKVPDADKVKDLNKCARSLRDLAENAKTIHSKTQTNYSGTSIEAGVRNLGQRVKVGFFGNDSNNLVTISDKLNEIAGYIDKLKNSPDIKDISAANKVSTDAIGLINEYKKSKITKDGPLYQKKEDFVETSRKYLENIREVTEFYSDNKINEIADEISKEIDKISDPTNPKESSDNLRKLASIASKIRENTKNIQQAKDYAAKVPLFNCFDAALSKAKDIALAAENAFGYDQNNLQNISNHLNNIAKNGIQKSNYTTFKKDIEAVRAFLNGYQTGKINNKKDALTEVRKKFIDKTTTHLGIVEEVLQDLTPEEKLKEIVARLSDELKEIDIKKNEMPAVYAKQLEQLAKIGPEIRKETQDLKNYSNFWKSVTNSAQTLADMFTHINEDNISNISNNLNNIAKKIPDCKVDEINKTESLVQKYAVKKSGVADDLSAIRSNFATKVTECLTEVKEITQAFEELKEKFKSKNKGEQLSNKSSDYIKKIIGDNIDIASKDDTMASNFSEEIKNKLNTTDKNWTLSDDFLTSIMPSPSKVKETTTNIVKSVSSALGENGSIFGTAASKAIDFAADRFLKDKCTEFYNAIKGFFKNMHSAGNPVNKYKATLEKISNYSPEQFKKEIQETLDIGSSYEDHLEKLREALCTFMINFYGCDISADQKVAAPSASGNFKKWINVFRDPGLFSNAVSLCNNFDSCIIKLKEKYPYECLSKQCKSKGLENKLKDLETKEKYFTLYNRIMSCKKKLEINEKNYKFKKGKEQQAEELIKETIFPKTNGEIPDSEEAFLNAVSKFMDKGMEILEGALGGKSSIDSEIAKHKSMCMLETMIKNKGFNNFDEEEYNSFIESYKNFTNNYKYLKDSKLI